jgi:hypothetical protein
MFLNLNEENRTAQAPYKFGVIAGGSLFLILVAAMQREPPAGYDPTNFTRKSAWSISWAWCCSKYALPLSW